MTSLALQRHSGSATKAGVLEWMDAGFLGRTGTGGKEGT